MNEIDAANRDGLCAALAAQYGEEGARAAAHLRHWLSGAVPEAYPETIARQLSAEHLDLLFDAFRAELTFGTAGARGTVGYGPNRFNMTTVLRAVQGHCDYLRSAAAGSAPLSVVVANDVRVFSDVAGVYRFLGDSHPLLGASSRTFAQRACEVYAANGLTAYMADPERDDAVLSTPMLSFLIPQLQASGGVNLSASHNPPDDNGIKVYDRFGGQYTPPDDQALGAAIDQVDHITTMPFAEALAAGRILPVPQELLDKYVATYVSAFGSTYQPAPDDPEVVYTPLCGCGLTTAGRVLAAVGFRYLVPPDQHPDGSFAAIPLRAPNPEVYTSALPARALADQHGLKLVLSSDPDADRVGVEVGQADGSWHHLDGDQIAAIVCYFLMLDEHGPQKRGLVIETLVTTRLLGAIVQQAQASGECWIVDDLLVGFKYIAEVLRELEQHGSFRDLHCRPDQLVLAAEESHGQATLSCIRDKDSTPACLYVATLYHRLRREGRTLVDYYAEILDRLGHYDSVARALTMRGAAGFEKKERLMASLRQSPPTVLAGRAVLRVNDCWDEAAHGPFLSETDRSSRDVLQYFTQDCILAVRPSGTEPKLKIYCQSLPRPDSPRLRGRELLDHLRAESEQLAREVCRELLDRIGLTVGEAGLRVLDVVDLDQRKDFDERVAPLLRERLGRAASGDLPDLLAWLRQETARMTPGMDPGEALKPALVYLCDQWAAALAGAPLYEQLKTWATGAA